MFTPRRVTKRPIGTPRASLLQLSNTEEHFSKNLDGHSIRTSSYTIPKQVLEIISNKKAENARIISKISNQNAGVLIDNDLYIWKLDEGQLTNIKLPKSRINNYARLFAFTTVEGVITCTPDGKIRYWPTYKASDCLSTKITLTPDVFVTSIEANQVLYSFFSHKYFYFISCKLLSIIYANYCQLFTH